ncbi:hypothetical protein HYH03_007897 [Edaphochlamys debaryana]|uniref:BTB domain-containing protein n=1 Tax=Edaphochlamys debaryana TaxID=47281 RepID=A0A835YAH5_9CHLO|nr:hypothetical protein HYH03_007897 [Edaphochlamys debaryana]|eukprot:KAG2493969.1 hypothetical protein HYH03_007897 [Edaphochlamys debaryana]
MAPLQLTCSLDSACCTLVTRQLPGGDDGQEPQLETLACLLDGSLRTLLGANGRSGLELGPPQQLPPPVGLRGSPIQDAVYDAFTNRVLISYGGCIGSLTASNALRPVAGHLEEGGVVDGPGPDARLECPSFLCSDGRGGLYFTRGSRGAMGERVVRLQMPTSWRAGAEGGKAAGGDAPGMAGAGAAEQAHVTTLPFRMPSAVQGLAYSPPPSGGSGCGALVIATQTALYRLPLGEGGAVGDAPAPVLWVGREGEMGTTDGPVSEARFCAIWELRLEADGTAWVAEDLHRTTAVRRVAPDGTVTTLARVSGRYRTPIILPNGYLVLCCADHDETDCILALDLGLKSPPLGPTAAAAPAAGPPRRTLHADMGALLDAQPDGTADLTLVVAGRRFPVHRAILIARGDYFKRRLAAETFADGSAAELSLPDTDPAAFALLLRFVYTGAADIPPALAPAVAELADRLLVPELCADAQAAVLSSMSAETVVGSLLWAEQLGGSFSGLLSSLKAWYLEHHEEVLEAAPESVGRLASESPSLLVELMRGLTRSAKRQRIA